MKLATIPNLVGGHLGGWRHRDAFDQPVMNLEAFIEMSQIAERGKFDCVFLADVPHIGRPLHYAWLIVIVTFVTLITTAGFRAISLHLRASSPTIWGSPAK